MYGAERCVRTAVMRPPVRVRVVAVANGCKGSEVAGRRARFAGLCLVFYS